MNPNTLTILARCARACEAQGLYAQADYITATMQRVAEKPSGIPCENGGGQGHNSNAPTYFHPGAGKYLCKPCADKLKNPKEQPHDTWNPYKR